MLVRALAFTLLCLSLGQAQQVTDGSTASLALPSQTSTVTTLPPAQVNNSDSNPCAFADRRALLERVVGDWQGYNVSLLVEKCPNVCVLIYGAGNPDVSGIGVLVSYIAQFVSTALVGPVLLYLLFFEDNYSDSFEQFLSMVINDIMPDVNSGNNWIMFSIMIASFIRLDQDPPVFELDFIQTLLWFQWLMALARSICAIALASRQDESRRGALFLMGLLTVVAFFFALGVSNAGVSPTNTTQSEALVAISRFCAYENDLPIPLYVEPAEEKKAEFPIWGKILLRIAAPLIYLVLLGLVTVVGGILVVVVWGFLASFTAVKTALSARLPNDFKEGLRTLGLWAFTAISVIIYLIPGGLWLAICVWQLTSMQSARNDLQMALGNNYLDSYWGFGQVTILVMLIPTIIQILGKMSKFRPKTKQPQDEGETSDHPEVQQFPYSDADQPIQNENEHISLPSNALNPSGERNYRIEPTGESSSRSSRIPTVAAPQDGDVEMETFELKQRVLTFPKDAEGNILPVHIAKNVG